MRNASLRTRLLKDERGFTLAEMTVTIMIMMVVFLALHSIFDMTLRVYSYGNNKVEATETARVALEKMEREIRQAAPYNQPTDLHLFDQRTATAIRFGNDLNGNGAIQCLNSTQCETIGYQLNGTTLERDNSTTGANFQPVAENVQSLTFNYYNKSGVAVPTAVPEATDPDTQAATYIDRVQVSLVVSVDQGVGNPGTQTLTSVIDLRNR